MSRSCWAADKQAEPVETHGPIGSAEKADHHKICSRQRGTKEKGAAACRLLGRLILSSPSDSPHYGNLCKLWKGISLTQRALGYRQERTDAQGTGIAQCLHGLARIGWLKTGLWTWRHHDADKIISLDPNNSLNFVVESSAEICILVSNLGP